MADFNFTQINCIDYPGLLNNKGYPPNNAHRKIYQWFTKQELGKLEIDHTCRNRWCMNPTHMEPVDRWENVMRGIESRGTCKRGHPYNTKNRYQIPGTNASYCRPCQREKRRTGQWQ